MFKVVFGLLVGSVVTLAAISLLFVSTTTSYRSSLFSCDRVAVKAHVKVKPTSRRVPMFLLPAKLVRS